MAVPPTPPMALTPTPTTASRSIQDLIEGATGEEVQGEGEEE